MKIGIILIFNNNEEQIEKGFFIEQMNASETIELCLVDNESKDKTLRLLKDIKEACSSNVSVVEIKKHISEEAAKRAGSRYMFNQFNLRHIGYINVNSILRKGEDLNTLIESVCTNQEFIRDLNLKIIEDQDVKQTLFKSIFSIVDYLKRIKTKRAINNLNTSV